MTLSRLLRICEHRLQSLVRKKQMDGQIDEELSFHFEHLVEENIGAGMRVDAARREARRTLGNFAVIKEECRDQRRVGLVHDFLQDVRYGLRMMRKHAGLTTIAAISMAVGIGAIAAILSVAGTLVVRDLPLPQAERLVLLGAYPAPNSAGNGLASIPEYVALKDGARTFESMGASLPFQQDFGAERAGDYPERIAGHAVTPSLFQTLNVHPILGRVFREDEARIGTRVAPVVVLSHRLWQRRFGGDPHVIDRQIRMDGVSMTIIGVMPRGFWYPNVNTEYWIPLGLTRFQLEGTPRFFLITARLKSGATLDEAQADIGKTADQLAHDFPDRQNGWTTRAVPIREFWFGWLRQPLTILGAAAALGLLIACAHVSILLLRHVPARRPEISMRLRMGAGRGRIVRQFLTESLLLSAVAGGLGLLVAWWGVSILLSINAPPGRTPISAIGEIGGIPGFTALLSAISGLLFGFLPTCAAAFSSGDELRQARTLGSHRSASGIVVSVQVGVALILLVTSGLLVNSFIRLVLDDRGFDPRGMLTFQYRISVLEYGRPSGTYYGLPAMKATPPTEAMQRVYERLQMLEGAESVAASSAPPVNGVVLPTAVLRVDGRAVPANLSERAAATANYFLVTEHFFATMKTSIVRGRDFDARRDTSSAPWVAVINETLARRFWPGEDPIGKRFIVDAISGERVREVIGVARDIPPQYIRTGPPRAAAYTLYRQQPEKYEGLNAGMFGEMRFFIRSAGDPMLLAPAARQAVAEADPDRSPVDFRTMEAFVGAGMRMRGFYISALGMFALMATVLSAIGVYSVMTLSVSQRLREVGKPMTLGNRARDILVAAGSRALRPIAIGLLFGIVGALALSRWIESQLWQVTPTDPATFATVTVLLIAVFAAACFIPARRAMRGNTNGAFRTE